jgi:hypothetical protein
LDTNVSRISDAKPISPFGAEIQEAFEDYQLGRMGEIPAGR